MSSDGQLCTHYDAYPHLQPVDHLALATQTGVHS